MARLRGRKALTHELRIIRSAAHPEGASSSAGPGSSLPTEAVSLGTDVAGPEPMRLQCTAAVIAITVLGSGAAAADPAITHEVSAGVLGRNVAWFAGSAWRHEVEVATRAALAGPHALPLTAVGGLRLAVFSEVRVPIEGFVRVELTGRFGRVMEPTCGLELAFGRLDQPDLRRPAGAADLQSERTGLFSASIVATPLRLRVGRFHIIVADFQLGTSIGGSVSRFGIGYAKVEMRL